MKDFFDNLTINDVLYDPHKVRKKQIVYHILYLDKTSDVLGSFLPIIASRILGEFNSSDLVVRFDRLIEARERNEVLSSDDNDYVDRVSCYVEAKRRDCEEIVNYDYRSEISLNKEEVENFVKWMDNSDFTNYERLHSLLPIEDILSHMRYLEPLSIREKVYHWGLVSGVAGGIAFLVTLATTWMGKG